MSKREEEFLKRLQATFRLEAEEHLQAMGNGLLQLESSADDGNAPIVESIFRDAHSLKGAARAVNMTEVEGICQSLESVLSAWKRQQIRPTPDLYDTLNRSLVIIANLLDLPAPQNLLGSQTYTQVLHELRDWQMRSESLAMSPGTEPLGEADPFAELNSYTTAPKMNGKFVEHSAVDQPAPPVNSALTNSIEIEPVIGNQPPAMSTETSTISANGHSAAKGEAAPAPPEPAIPPAAAVPTVREAFPPPAAPATRPSAAPGPVERNSTGETIRIATSKLDSLLLQAEELLAAKQTLAQRTDDLNEVRALVNLYERQWSKVSRGLKAMEPVALNVTSQTKGSSEETTDIQHWHRSSLRMLDAKLVALSSALEQDQRALNSMVDTLLDDMKRVLMMPFSSLFEVFPRLVRDLARSLDKEARLEIQGGEIEIDRRILEEMKDPLIHLIRNSLDHGLEPLVERQQLGKTPGGTISITVQSHDSGRVEIVLADDGRGIDSERVREAAVEKGAISHEQADELDERQTLMLIFQSEVSTSSMITDLSGRGLGMAIVREKVEKMGGHIAVETEVGKFTSFRIVLPLTLATFRGILLQSSNRQFIVPTANVERVLRLPRAEVKIIGGHATINLDGQAISLVGLHSVLELPAGTDERQHLTVVVLGRGDQRIGFIVDEVLDEQEVLVKSLGRQLVRVRNIAGATVLGSGHVVPILNASDLIKSAFRNSKLTAALPEAVADTESALSSDEPKRSILIAEDSITSRMLLKNILEAAGYRVKTTVDGAEAFTALQQEAFDLVVSDVEMPRLNGFELTEKIRSDKKNSAVPVVLVTSLSSREHQERGMDAGANAYIVKSSFDQGNLLDAVRRLIAHSN